MLERARLVASGTEGIVSTMSPFAHLLPEETQGAILTLRSPGATLSQLRDIFTSDHAVTIRKHLQETSHFKRTFHPISSYEALFDAASLEETPEKQIRAFIIYGNYHLAENVGKSFYHSLRRKGAAINEDECIATAFAFAIPYAIDSLIVKKDLPVKTASYIQTAVKNKLTDFYRYEVLHTKSPVKIVQRTNLKSYELLSEESGSHHHTLTPLLSGIRENDPEKLALFHELLREIGNTLKSQKNKFYSIVFLEMLEGATIQDLMKKYGKNEGAIKMALKRALELIEPHRPNDLPQEKHKKHFITNSKSLRRQTNS